MPANNNAEVISFSVSTETKSVIDHINKLYGLKNRSAALRIIVHDWARAQGIDPEDLLATTLPQPEAQK